MSMLKRHPPLERMLAAALRLGRQWRADANMFFFSQICGFALKPVPVPTKKPRVRPTRPDGYW